MQRKWRTTTTGTAASRESRLPAAPSYLCRTDFDRLWPHARAVAVPEPCSEAEHRCGRQARLPMKTVVRADPVLGREGSKLAPESSKDRPPQVPSSAHARQRPRPEQAYCPWPESKGVFQSDLLRQTRDAPTF